MDQKSEYLIQVLEKIGAPLMSSITEVSGAAGDDATPDVIAAQSAQKMAELLGKSVQIGIDLGKNMNLAGAEDRGESLRVSLTALAGTLVSEQYKQSKNIPDDSAITKIVASLQAVLTFSENFIPSPEATQRLKDLEARGAIVDESQTNLQLIHAFLPVVLAVSTFSFGINENKLIQNISKRLIEKSATLRKDMFGDGLSVDEEKSVDLAILRSLVQVYAACHAAEMDKLTAEDENELGDEDGPINAVWSEFDMRAALISTLAASFAPNKSAGNATPPPAPESITMPTEPDTETTAETPAASSNPMSMFSKPKDEPAGEAESVPEPTDTVPEPDVPTEPVAPIDVPEGEQQQPPTTPAEEKPSGGPMSFFTQPKTEQDGDE